MVLVKILWKSVAQPKETISKFYNILSLFLLLINQFYRFANVSVLPEKRFRRSKRQASNGSSAGQLPSESQCGLQVFDDKIVGGDIAGLDEFPWMALLYFKGSKLTVHIDLIYDKIDYTYIFLLNNFRKRSSWLWRGFDQWKIRFNGSTLSYRTWIRCFRWRVSIFINYKYKYKIV